MAPSKQQNPLDWRVPIVDKEGKPTNEFQRKWALQLGINGNIPANASAYLDTIGSTRGDVLYRGADGWHVLHAGTAGEALVTGGPGADPDWGPVATDVQTLLDGISSTHGVVLFRGAADWVALAPGADGQVLTSGGAAANIAWEDATGGNTIYFGHGPPSTLRNHGDFYFDIDTTPYTQYVQWDGTVGQAGGGGGGGGGSGALELISEVVTSASQASVAFSAIPASWRDLVLVVRGRLLSTSTGGEIYAQFNGDTGTNYSNQVIFGAGASAGAANTNDTRLTLGNIADSTFGVNQSGATETVIQDYTGTVFTKQCNSVGGMPAVATTRAGTWYSTTALTDILVFTSSIGFVDGSVVSLYGRH